MLRNENVARTITTTDQTVHVMPAGIHNTTLSSLK